MIAGCGRTLDADLDGQIQSVGWPVSYEMNSDCSWLIQSSNLGKLSDLAHLFIELYRRIKSLNEVRCA